MRREDTDTPYIVRVFDLRDRVIEVRTDMMLSPGSEALDTAAGALTCAISFLADHINNQRRWHTEQTEKPKT